MRRRAVVAGAAVVVAATATGGGWWLRARPAPGAAASSAQAATGTVPVVRTDLSTTTHVTGALGFRDAYTVFAQGPGGTVTGLPRPGQVIGRGEPVFELDGLPVRLLYGARPAWRPFAAGMTAGADVRALEENLVALGHGRSLTVDDRFTAATAAAVRRWQQATGQTATGRVELGAVTFQPGPVRVTELTAKLGATNRGEEPVLSGTSTAAAVTISVPAGRSYFVHAGDPVTVTMPDGAEVKGTVAYLSAVAETAPSMDGRAPQPMITGLVTLDDPSAAGDLDRAPVQVNVTGKSVRGVLAVPVTALVALAGGGYGVWIRAGAQRRLAGVTTGLFAETLVEVRGDLREGDLVEVPVG
ncbi:peptidoglycan-binding protein [Dactylosporangium sp. NBC_01737]|uniref:efflux RND transporter periplasmic adaptor subunit n=1 Tax=Dactylosporangium sp. NBC_01737 TaxID=2975959 RepID=UPI002E1158C4|nr:peptidoglycan-binding protein [Dactylosporangium sp. NBC_01737]